MQDWILSKKEAWKNNRISLSLSILVFLCPFFYYYKVIIPGCSFSLAISNDFIPLYYTYKVYLLDLLAHGHFPLWSPAEASGYPFYSNPFTQAFYPLNLPLVLFYKIAGGYSIFDHQVFSVIGVSVFALGLFLWLNLLIPNVRAVFFSTVLISLSFKLGEILRFPNAVHAAAWMPWILFGITSVATKGQYVRGGLIILASSTMLLSSGYLYYGYYGLFLFPPYAALLCFFGSRQALVRKPYNARFSPQKFLLTLFISSGSALALCTPYLIKIWQLLKQTADRTGSDYGYATFQNFDFQDTLGSFLFPPAAQAEGWFYFGMLGVFMLAIYLAALFLNRTVPRPEKIFIVIGGAWIVLISAITYGKHSFLFDLLWSYMPGFSSLRVWGRMNVILLPVFAMLLARAYDFFESFLSSFNVGSSKRRRDFLSFSGLLAGTATVLISVQLWLYLHKSYNSYWLLHFNYAHGREWTFIASTVLSFLLVLLVFALAMKQRIASSRSLVLLLVCFLFFALNDMHPVGSSQWMQKAPKTYGSERKVFNFHEIIERSLTTPRIRLYYTMTFPRFNAGWICNWYFERYLAFDAELFPDVRDMVGKDGILHYGTPMKIGSGNHLGKAADYHEFMGLRTGKRIFASQKIDHASIQDFVSDSTLTESTMVPEIKVSYYDGDTLTLMVRNVKPVYLSFIDNWDPDWRAFVNGEPTPILKLFGTFKSVQISPGKNIVTFTYRPFS
jgi:hypothetical protein